MEKPKSKLGEFLYSSFLPFSFPTIKDVMMLCHMSKDETVLVACSEI